MLMYVQPWSTSPLFTIASAAAFTLLASTADAKQFQLFQPIAGVSPIRSPQMILNFCGAAARAFRAISVTGYSPFSFNTPVIRPVSGSSCNPAGNPFASKASGRSPVAAIVKRNGDPGRTPKTFALLIRGAGPGFGVRTTA